MIRFRCPQCEAEMEVDESFGGRPARCPTCGADIRIPTAEETQVAKALEAPSKSGATVVRIGGETIEIVPPIEAMAVAGVALLAASVAVALAVGLARIARFPWTVGLTLGAAFALLATITGLPAWHTIRRSRGRKRGKLLAVIASIGGAGLMFLFGAGAVAGWIMELALRPSCDENLHKIYGALQKYAAAHQGEVLPRGLEVLVSEKYLDSANALTCPATGVAYSMHIGRPPVNLNDPIFPPNLALVSDAEPYRHEDGGMRVLLLGGDVKVVPYREWQAFRDEQRKLWNDIQRKAEKRKAPPAASETPP
jgi:DNA-directed RNA polymerase subunit RPC12/RpoP